MIAAALAGLFFSATAMAQNNGTVAVPDSSAFKMAPAVDSALVGKNIFWILPSKANGDKGEVKVHQSQSIIDAFNQQIVNNSSRNMLGYRVRIFNDNRQSARGGSEAALSRFKSLYPKVPAYRTYSNPFFKVTVGDFRSRSEAAHICSQLKDYFPSAFVVKEIINYPAVDRP